MARVYIGQDERWPEFHYTRGPLGDTGVKVPAAMLRRWDAAIEEFEKVQKQMERYHEKQYADE